MTAGRQAAHAEEIKTCCADLYATDWVRLLLGDSLHPGGLALTERLGVLLGIGPSDRVLDVAAGRGASAIHLATRFGCRVLGVEYGAASVVAATEAAERAGVASLVQFVAGDAESLGLANGAFDAVICECAFCTFPDKVAASREWARVLRPGGRVGLSDLTRRGPLPPELADLFAWVACLADARPLAEYEEFLRAAGFAIDQIEPHDEGLQALIDEIRGKLLAAELVTRLRQMALPGIDLTMAQPVARRAAEVVQDGRLGYALLTGTKSPAGKETAQPVAPGWTANTWPWA